MLNTTQLSQSMWNFIIGRRYPALTCRDIKCQITKPCNEDIRIFQSKDRKESFKLSGEWDFPAAPSLMISENFQSPATSNKHIIETLPKQIKMYNYFVATAEDLIEKITFFFLIKAALI